MARIDTHTRRSRVNGQEPEEIAANDLSFFFQRHFAVEQGVVLGPTEMHQGKGGIAAESDPVGAEDLDRVEDGGVQDHTANQA